jgi:hypothetical protein
MKQSSENIVTRYINPFLAGSAPDRFLFAFAGVSRPRAPARPVSHDSSVVFGSGAMSGSGGGFPGIAQTSQGDSKAAPTKPENPKVSRVG